MSGFNSVIRLFGYSDIGRRLLKRGHATGVTQKTLATRLRLYTSQQIVYDSNCIAGVLQPYFSGNPPENRHFLPLMVMADNYIDS